MQKMVAKEEDGNKEDRTELLKKGAQRLRCSVCGAPARLRVRDRAIVCRDGGHIIFPDGKVVMPDGTVTSLEELKERGIIKG